MSDFLDGAKPISAASPPPSSGDFLADAKPVKAAPKTPEPEGGWHSFFSQFGLTPEQGEAARQELLNHPLKSLAKAAGGPAASLAESLYGQAKKSGGELIEAGKSVMRGNPAEAVGHVVEATPIVGPAINKAAEQSPARAGDSYGKQVLDTVTSPAMGTLAGAAVQAAPIVAGQIEKIPAADAALAKVAAPIQSAVDVAKRVPVAASTAKAAFNRAAYPKNISIPDAEATTQNFVKALVPDAPAIPNIKSAAVEVPDALAAAQKKGMPINGKLDMVKALEDRAAEVQGHYSNEILRPHTGDLNHVPDNYGGDTTTAGRATLDQINNRVDFINRELKTNFRKKLASQTTEANASDADLIAEKQGLTTILHNRLADLTGLAPEDIASLRQRAGKLRSLAQEVEVSADRDTTTAGRRDTSGGTMSMKNPLEGVIDRVGGGQEIIGNRVFKTALDKFTPAEQPLPQPKAPGPNVATTPEMAQQEFLRSQQLEQASQDAAAGRDSRVQGYRAARAATADASAKLEGEAARGVGRYRVRQAWVDKGAANISAADPSFTQETINSLGQTIAGKNLLMRASGIPPASPIMGDLISQAKKILAPPNSSRMPITLKKGKIL